MFYHSEFIFRKKASDKAKQLPKLGLNGNTPTPSSQVSVPPGVWTSSPTMVAVPPPQMGYNPPPQRGPSLPQENIKRPKRLPRDGKVPSEMRQAPQPSKSFLHWVLISFTVFQCLLKRGHLIGCTPVFPDNNSCHLNISLNIRAIKMTFGSYHLQVWQSLINWMCTCFSDSHLCRIII